MIRRPPRSTLDRSSAASDVYKRQDLYGLMSGDAMDLPYDQAVDLDDADMESVSDASIDDIILTEEELIATGGFRLGQLRAVSESGKSRPRQAPKSPPPPAKSSSARVPKAPPKSSAKPAKKTRGAATPDNAWAVQAKQLLERWLPDTLD